MYWVASGSTSLLPQGERLEQSADFQILEVEANPNLNLPCAGVSSARGRQITSLQTWCGVCVVVVQRAERVAQPAVQAGRGVVEQIDEVHEGQQAPALMEELDGPV